MTFQIDIWSWFLYCPQVDTSVFDSREMVQSLAFGLSFLQRMDMKVVVVMGLPPEMEEEDSTKTETNSSLARTEMVKHCQALTEALQHNSANVMPFFSSEALLQLQDPQDKSRFSSHFKAHSHQEQYTLLTSTPMHNNVLFIINTHCRFVTASLNCALCFKVI